ncbi:MAG: DUF192 domain-containing protein [archaeon]
MRIINQTRKIELEAMHARSPLALTRGLMLKKKGNMLLEFPYAGRHGIWMLCMRYSLDLIYIDREKKVTEIKKNIPPITFNPKTWKIYTPKEKAKYVLEVEKGLSVDFSAGDTLEFRR